MRSLTPKLAALLSIALCIAGMGFESVEGVKYQEVDKTKIEKTEKIKESTSNLYINLDTEDWEKVDIVGLKSCKYSSKDGIIQLEYFSDGLEGYVLGVSKEEPNATTRKEYRYTLNAGKQRKDIITLTEGPGEYRVRILKHKRDTLYTLINQFYIKMDTDTNKKYLISTTQVPFEDSKYLNMLKETLKKQDFSFKKSAVTYVMNMITYDDEKADKVQYMPLLNYKIDIDETIQSQKGICLDTSTLLASLLRSEGIPTKVIYGDMGTEYHSWVEIYDETNSTWQLIDPTVTLNAKRVQVDYIKKYTF